jgi:hypothetical protein
LTRSSITPAQSPRAMTQAHELFLAGAKGEVTQLDEQL